MTFRARFTANIIQFAAQQGADRRVLLDLVDSDLTELNNDELMFEAGVYNQVLEKALELTRQLYQPKINRETMGEGSFQQKLREVGVRLEKLSPLANKGWLTEVFKGMTTLPHSF